MELSNRHEEDGGDIPMPMMIHHQEPIASSHTNNHHHHQIMNSNGNNINMNPNSSLDQDHENQQVVPYKKMTTMKYRECLKNHAAAMGGNATDGCGEFMPSGEEGTIEALTCSACNCHRNFHRKEVEDQTSSPSCDCFHSPQYPNRGQQRKLHLLSHHHHHHNAILGPAPESLGYPTRPTPHHHQQMIMSYNMGFVPNSDHSDEQEEDIGGSLSRPAHHHQHLLKKRHRTKFSQEQKEKMLNFAEKVGWKFQKQEESIVQQFCQEIGVKRRVLKVWMHNNKHNLAKKNMMNIIPQTTTNSLT
ncbi:zinc-finger homeodomain protein 3-like [Impatiens glandulifera]|uniref:zinc-finger homeodomain protein 3-like n=1 Tax=Impatiens glandulifera TaxID=253017 RepID=UPI001FB11BF0|nr:zinc-finger homeodomain protein 3-like [Impatiens glandulifera]